MSVVRELITAIEADPHDVASQMVIADYLQAEGDPRGELIVLDHLDRTTEITDPEVLERILLLAAEYSFPRAQPEEPMLPWQLFRHRPLEYRVEYEQRWFSVQWVRRLLTVRERGNVNDFGDAYHRNEFRLSLGKRWGETETNVILTILGDAIRAKTPLDDLEFPYGTLKLPTYDGGPLRCYMLPVDFLARCDLLRNRYGLAARDYHRWHFIWHRLKSIESAPK